MANKNKKDKLAVFLLTMAGVAGVILLAAIGAYVVRFFGTEFSRDPTRWAEFGDYLGGTLSPAMAFFALLALLYTISLQSKELSRSTEQLKRSAQALDEQNEYILRQNQEGTFFNLLSLYQSALGEIEYKHITDSGMTDDGSVVLPSSVAIKGRSALAEQITILAGTVGESDFGDLENPRWREDQADFLQARYENMLVSTENGIQPYNNVVLNILECLNGVDDDHLKNRLSNIFLSCLSRHEKINLFCFYIIHAGTNYKNLFDNVGFLGCMNIQDLEHDFLIRFYSDFVVAHI